MVNNVIKYNTSTARIRMRVLTVNGMPNYNWHSPEKYDNKTKSDQAIIAGMLRRFMEKPYAKDAQVIIFYDNKTNVQLDRYDR